VIFPAHDAPSYLDEIGTDRSTVLSDEDWHRPGRYLLRLPSGDRDLPMLRGTDPEVVFFTSGSTDAPKAVAKRLSCLELEAAVLARILPLPPCEVEATVSHQHIYGLLYRVVWPVLAGHVSRIAASDYWEQLADRLGDRTILVTSPVHLTRMPEGLPWQDMRPALIVSSGAPLPFQAACDAATKLGKLPTEVLGSTETGGVAWRQQTGPDTSWTPFPGLTLAADPAGCLLVRSPFIGNDQPFAMADRVAFQADGGFRLLGRMDRVVKLEGKRVSLPRVEQALLGLAEVSDAAVVDLPERKGALGAAVLLSEAGRAGLEREGAYRFSRRLRRALARHLESMERPKVWRFPQAIPTNSQSKRQVAAVRALFAPARPDVLPPSELLRLSDTEALLSLDLDPGLVWFQGHFPGFAILPGVAQIHLSRLFAEQLWHMAPASSDLTRVKFRKLIRPGDRVHLHLLRDVDKATLRVRFENDGRPASEGVIGQI
jgi:acyl-coenzyme A synthetase/AMP-(fatty) acid ligase